MGGHRSDLLYGRLRLHRPTFRAIFDMREVRTMTEMRSLFEALGVLGFIIATGTMLELLLR